MQLRWDVESGWGVEMDGERKWTDVGCERKMACWGWGREREYSSAMTKRIEKGGAVDGVTGEVCVSVRKLDRHAEVIYCVGR